MAIYFYRKRGSTRYIVEDQEAGYYSEVDLDEAIKRLAHPIIYEAFWRDQTGELGLDPVGRPLHVPLPSQEGALPAGEKG